MTFTTEQQIEYLCEQSIPDYVLIKPDKALTRLLLARGPNGRTIGPDEERDILSGAMALKAQLRKMTDGEIATRFENARAHEWRGKHLNLNQAAQTIACRLHPDDHYPWETEQRNQCEASYLPHLKKIILLGAVDFFNPHSQKKFDHIRLSEINFPNDGLLQVHDLHRCLMREDVGHSAFPVPPKAISKAPRPISPLVPTLTNVRSAPPPPEKRVNGGRSGMLYVSKPVNIQLWMAKDLWEEKELACLMCGVEPTENSDNQIRRSIGKAQETIQRAIAAERLVPVVHQVESPGWFVPPSTIRYFKLCDAITWANTKRAEFPDFPDFSGVDSTASKCEPVGSFANGQARDNDWGVQRSATAAKTAEATGTGVQSFVAGAGASWPLKKPLRYQGYGKPLYDVLKTAHSSGKECPTARDVLDAFKASKPPEVIEVMVDGIKYYDSNGDPKPADLRAIAKAIGRLVELGPDSPE